MKRTSKVLGSWVSKDIIERVARDLPPNLRYIDLGCGDGHLTIRVSRIVGAKEVYGVDVDNAALKDAEENGIRTVKANLSLDQLPFSDNYFDLVTAFEVIEHLVNPDNMLKEAYRVLQRKGSFMIGTPNLGRWLNRLYLLLGYQLPDIDVSTEVKVGVHKLHGGKPSGHVRGYVVKALIELLEHHGFRVTKTVGVAHTLYKLPNILHQIDIFLAKVRPSLAHHIIVVARK